ncbi:cysteine desulfurase [candidate division WOR_3 bacterium SM23_42]|uniref:Cysteine desulfurase n=1 Tax=candidate division WOR_3 bacterium SM23_42 TaxID=1703779 RepID=A0A0S8FW89_UNCW3|nr:MAG: cysteine desulfurase [candidate division WOR_3 bacterium SM23_42]
MIYLDYNATTPTDSRVVEAMLPYFHDISANPSSIHTAGHKAREALEGSRTALAELLKSRNDEIYFTSGGTEADNTAIKGTSFAQDKRKKIITSAIEHHAVLTTCEYMKKFGFRVVKVPVDHYGVVDLDFLEQEVDDNTLIVSIMHANNEVGTIEPLEKIGEIVHRHGVIFHTDAVQTVGKIPIDVRTSGIDMLSLSAHKFCGPKGIGALYVRKGVRFDPLSHGGHHEGGKRAGTENVPGIVGLGKACEIALDEMSAEEKRIRKLRDRLWQGISERIPELKLNGHPEKRLANTLNVSVKYVEGESMLLQLDARGIFASSGSACTSGSLEASHVLLAMGLPHDMAHGSLRFSCGRYNTERDIDKVIEVFPGIVEKLRVMSPLYRP